MKTKHISKLFEKNNFPDKPWLIVGKGPSFDEISNFNLDDYYVFTLNHVIKEVTKVDVAHLIDFDVFESCANEIYSNARYLCMPINPHFNNKASETNLVDLLGKNEILKKLYDENRLFWYNHIKGDEFLKDNNRFRSDYENVEVNYFSAEVPFYVLGMFGFKELYSIGLDGGASYSAKFASDTLLANGRYSFDNQFNKIIDSIEKFDLTYSPLDSQYPIKVYVGSQEEQMLSVKVLEYSIKKRTKVPVEVFPMHRSDIKYAIPKDPNNRQRTPFSFQRFTIPQLNGFTGKAIYVDSDMQVFKDIRQLWNLPMSSHDLFTVKKKHDTGRDLQFSVMLLDCDKLKWSVDDVVAMLDSGKLNYHSLMKEMRVAKNIGVKIPHTWNCLEWYKEGESALVHYTDMNTQPWVSTKNPLCGIWMKDLIEAIDSGFIDISMVKEHVAKSWVRPSLIYQIENRILDSINLPKSVLEMDKNFLAPYQSLEHIAAKRKKFFKNQKKTVSQPRSEFYLPHYFSEKIVGSSPYKLVLRFIPSLKQKIKEIRKSSERFGEAAEAIARNFADKVDEKRRNEILEDVKSLKNSILVRVSELKSNVVVKVIPSVKKKLNDIERELDKIIKNF